MKFLARRRTAFTPVAVAAILILGQPTWHSFACGTGLVVLGQAFRIWAAGHIRKSAEITASGPFACVRNPLYLGSFVVLLGYAVIGARPWVGVGAVAFFGVFHGAAIAYEERYLTRVFGNVYLDYCKKTPRLIPRWPAGRRSERFSFRQVISNREHKSILCAGTILLAFVARIVLS